MKVWPGKRREARSRGSDSGTTPARDDPRSFRWRANFMLGLLVCCALGLVWRAVELQLKDHKFLAGQGDARFSRVAEITATRGTITDRYGEPLAVSTPVDSVWVNPKELALASDQLPRLAKALKRDKNELARRVTSNLDREFLYLVRHMQPSEAQKIRALGIPGVYLMREYRRYYPAGEVAGHILGFTSIDDEGQEGLELAFDHWLAGEDGAKRVIQNRFGEIVQNVEEIRAMRPGRNLVLSIDLRIQYLAYRELKAAIRDQRAKSGSVIVLDVATGEVLAMVNQPTYNPNDRDQLKARTYRNRAVTDIVEPGSSMKPFFVAAGLASGRFDDHSVIDTNPGYIKVGAKLLEDPHNLGAINLATCLSMSSNVCLTKVALALEPSQMYSTLTALGFGQVTTSGYPGESAGLLPHYSHWRPVGISSMSRGYGLSITPLQLAHAYATVGALGVSRPISFLRVETAPAGETALGFGQVTTSGYPGESAGLLPHYSHWRPVGISSMSRGYGLSITPLQLAHAYATVGALGVSRPISFLRVETAPAGETALDPGVSRMLIHLLETVVAPDGGGKRAAIPGYTVAGKTGTAWKATAGGYATDRYLAVFGGVAPASNPRLAAVVIIDEPGAGKYYGGEVAAPVFSGVVGGALRLLAVPPDAPVSDATEPARQVATR